MSLRAEGVTVSMGDKPVLHGVDVIAEAGHVTAIVGPNGSGKSTLLRALGGEEKTPGTVCYNDRSPDTAARTLARVRGVLPQAATMAFPFTVIEVLRIGHAAGPHAKDADIPIHALAAVGLAGYADRYYHELSGGEQQRAQLARVLCQVWHPVRAGEPCWLLLDEPVASLDIGHQIVVMQLARRYADAGGGVVTVMHDLNLTSLFADRVALIEAGRISAFGPPAEVLNSVTLSRAYDCHLPVSTPPAGDDPYILPHGVALTEQAAEGR